MNRNETWQKIFDECISEGIFLASVADLRKNVWPNLQKRAQKNAKTSSTTGASGSNLDELDEVILDIIGRDSPLLAPLPIVDAGAQILPPPIPLATSASSADDEETDQSINQSSEHR